MNFFTEMFSELTSTESLLVLLWLFLAGLIGFLTAWFYAKRNLDDVQQKYDAVEREAADLRIRNTELVMTQEEVRKEINQTKRSISEMEAANKLLSREKGQLYADMTLAKKELEDFKKGMHATPIKKTVEPK